MTFWPSTLPPDPLFDAITARVLAAAADRTDKEWKGMSDKPSGVAALEAKWRDAFEGMKFFGEPVQDMDADRLLLVIGYLITENRRLSDEAYGRWCFTPKEK